MKEKEVEKTEKQAQKSVQETKSTTEEIALSKRKSFVDDLKVKHKGLLKNYKEKYGEVSLLVIAGDGGFKYAVLKKPSIEDFSHASYVAGKEDYKFNQIILEDCWLSGDEEIKSNIDYLLSSMPYLDKLVTIFEADLEKL